MKAAILNQESYLLELKEVEIPTVKPFQVLVKLNSISLNHHELWSIKEQNLKSDSHIIMGSDGAGEIVETGEGVDKRLIGNKVIINPSLNWGKSQRVQGPDYEILGYPTQGTFAEYISIDHRSVYIKPKYLSFEEAAAIPLAGLTAYRALFVRGEIEKNDTVLITGAGGGAALFALQFAVHNGNKVYITSSSQFKINKAISLGAVSGVNYKDNNWVKDLLVKIKGFDLIIDSAGGEGFKDLAILANPGGRISLFGRTAGKNISLNASLVFWKQLSIHGTTMGKPEEFKKMLDFLDFHKIKPVIDSCFAFENIMGGFKRMDSSEQIGKIVVNF